jgi:DNA-binding Lrp family transcriptional regulator
VDQIDEQIVRHLVADAKASYPQLGKQVGLSASAVKRRVDRLVVSGVIARFTIKLNSELTGASTEAFVELFCSGRTSPRDISQLIDSYPEVVAAFTVTGAADALLHLRCESTTALERVLEQIRSDRHVDRTSSVVVLTRLIDR